MSPTATRKKPELDASSIPAVAQAITRRHEADEAETNKLLAAYRRAVEKAAAGEPITTADADSAVVAAHRLGLKGDRLDRDVLAMRQAQVAERGLAAYAEATPACRARSDAIKAELDELEAKRRSLRAESHRLGVRHYQYVNFTQQLREIKEANPQLFADAAEIDEAAWRHIRT